ncbi:MAG: hypothetical protein AAF720_07175 [Pseudomonadota bacterium]
MTPGYQILRDLDAAIVKLRADFQATSLSANGDSTAVTALEARELDAFMQFASIRLDLLTSDEAPHSITTEKSLQEIEKNALDILNTHAGYVADKREALGAAETSLKTLEKQRADEAENLNSLIERHEEAASATRQRLGRDKIYQSKQNALKDAEDVAERALKKWETARIDRMEKGAAYEADPLFNYLVTRGYGTSAYAAFPVFRILDDWVSGLIKFHRHKPNYDRLLEIPQRLEEHCNRLERLVEGAASALATIEQNALNADGVNALRDEATQARNAIDAIDKEITSCEQEFDAIAESLENAVSGKEGPLHDAHKLLASALKNLTIPKLHEIATQTETPEDDAVVEELIDIKRERFELEEDQKSAIRQLRRHRKALSDLEHIRKQFKNARFDSPYSEFRGDHLMHSLLTEFATSTLSREAFWRRLQKSHRIRRDNGNDRFGGETWRGPIGFPQQGRNTGWPSSGHRSRSWPSNRRNRITRRPSHSRLPSQGGFKTGGGF